MAERLPESPGEVGGWLKPCLQLGGSWSLKETGLLRSPPLLVPVPPVLAPAGPSPWCTQNMGGRRNPTSFKPVPSEALPANINTRCFTSQHGPGQKGTSGPNKKVVPPAQRPRSNLCCVVPASAAWFLLLQGMEEQLCRTLWQPTGTELCLVAVGPVQGSEMGFTSQGPAPREMVVTCHLGLETGHKDLLNRTELFFYSKTTKAGDGSNPRPRINIPVGRSSDSVQLESSSRPGAHLQARTGQAPRA